MKENKNSGPQISIIVPVYNVEQYLDRCLESLVCQTFSNIEIILIDDGSTDGSGSICDRYSEKDRRIKAIHQNNKGLSGARNEGLAHIKGKYVMFVDSDDYVDKDFCRIPYEIAEDYSADLVLFHDQIVSENDINVINKFETKKGVIGKQDTIDLMLKTVNVSVCVWNKLYKSDLFSNVLFPEDTIFEDNGVTYKSILKANKIYYTDYVLYHYCLRKDSLSQKSDQKSRNDYIDMYYIMFNDLNKNGYRCYVRVSIFMVSLWYLINFGQGGSKSKKCDLLVKNFTDFSLISLKNRMLFFLYMHSKPAFDLACTLFGKRKNTRKLLMNYMKIFSLY